MHATNWTKVARSLPGVLQARNEHALIDQKRARLGNHFALASSIWSLFAK
jgi:hypothetical protein